MKVSNPNVNLFELQSIKVVNVRKLVSWASSVRLLVFDELLN